LSSDRLLLPKIDDPRAAYRAAKATLAIVVASESKRRLQPIPPSADWRFDLAEGCHAHCQYCYLAGSLSGPPITRVYANIDEILEGLPAYLGRGTVTSRSATRADEGTTFEASCYADPLGIEHLTGSLAQDNPVFRPVGRACSTPVHKQVRRRRIADRAAAWPPCPRARVGECAVSRPLRGRR
jgi:spore photoproduct lyase